jgi:hypothetical protein
MLDWISIGTIILGIICILSSYYEWTWFWRLGGVGDSLYKRVGHSSMRLLYAFLGLSFLLVELNDWLDLVLPGVLSQLCFVVSLIIVMCLLVYGWRRNRFKKKSNTDNDSTNLDL